ncbi:helicase-related protein [Azospirillum doebereinerae]|uniref:helicase-related protein n=1 Tax=Azospirillum doebereinerae TaxID=92933 RepID=UPI00163BEE3E|nr:helicase-related protein [Azospirillum doebereinerae]
MTSTPSYADVLARKVVSAPMRGLDSIPTLSARHFPYQRDVVEFLLRTGCGAGFLDTGLGKTGIELDYARVIAEHTGKPALLFAPLAVGPQHVAEALKMGMDEVRVVRCQDDVRPGINIANYERLHLFQPHAFGALVLDESSILKSFSGVTTRKLMAFGSAIPYRTCFTATPAPNDHTELGQHAQFLGVMDSVEMLTRWFINDQKHMGAYRLKRYAAADYWNWTGTWARCLSAPSDLGYSDDGFRMPELLTFNHLVRVDQTEGAGEDRDGQMRLIRLPGNSATEIHKEKRRTADARARAIAEAVMGEPDEAWVIWCDTDYEEEALTALIPGSVAVRGSMKPDLKEERLIRFGRGEIKRLVTKPSIAGYGLNWQHCARTAFVGLSYSYEDYYQAIRRFWRFGQTRPVHVHTAQADTESHVAATVARKEADHLAMKREMAAAMRRTGEARGVKQTYAPTVAPILPPWLAGSGAPVNRPAR